VPSETCDCGDEAYAYTPYGWMCLTCFKRLCEGFNVSQAQAETGVTLDDACAIEDTSSLTPRHKD
jgi:hypothetical protein